MCYASCRWRRSERFLLFEVAVREGRSYFLPILRERATFGIF